MPSDKQYSPAQILKFIHEKKESFWLKERERRALALFHEASRRVPAYAVMTIVGSIKEVDVVKTAHVAA